VKIQENSKPLIITVNGEYLPLGDNLCFHAELMGLLMFNEISHFFLFFS